MFSLLLEELRDYNGELLGKFSFVCLGSDSTSFIPVCINNEECFLYLSVPKNF